MQRLRRNKHLALFMLVAVMAAPLQALASVYATPAPQHPAMMGHDCDNSGGQERGHDCHHHDGKQAAVQSGTCDGGMDCHACDSCSHCQYYLPEFSLDTQPSQITHRPVARLAFLSHTPEADLRPPKQA